MLYDFSTNLIIFLPELFFLCSILILLLWALNFTTKLITYNTKVITNLTLLLLEVHVITIILLTNNFSKKSIIFYESLLSDNYSVTLKIAILSCTILFFLLATNHLKQFFSSEFEFLILISLTIFALLLLISSNDLITFYLAIEMQSLCLYVLAAFKKTSQFSSEAGLKYFILGALSSSLLLFGMSLIYGTTGSTNFLDITKNILCLTNTQLETSYILILGIILLLCGLLFKITAVPFHIWSPDVYEGAPFLVMIFFSTIPKLAIFSILIKLLYSIFFNLNFIWQPLLINTALLTVTLSSVATLYQKKIKRFLAYSSINHVGYMLIGLSTGTLLGVHASFLYLVVYLITMFTLFGVLLSLKKSTNKNLIYLTDLLYLKQTHPIIKFILILLFFSMAGIPPLIGFFAKFYIFFTAIETHYYFLLTISILCSTLSAFYYIRIIKIINFENPVNKSFIKLHFNLENYKYILLGTIITIFFFLTPNFLVTKTYYLTLFL